MTNIFSKSCSEKGCTPTVRHPASPAFLPILNACGIKYTAGYSTTFLLFFIFCFLFQYPEISIAQRYYFKKFTVADGLGSSTINNIFQDSRGYIWFATQGGGISRFNGKEFKNFTKTDGLVYNDVTWITEDKKGNIWIGTLEGASEFNGNSFRNFKNTDGFTDGRVYGICADAKNNIWFATRDEGIKYYDGKKFDSLTINNGLPSNEVYSIAKDKAGNLWFGLYNGIVKYAAGKITAFNHEKVTKDKTFFSALADSKGNIWFGSTSGEVLIIHRDNTYEKLTLPEACRNDFIGSIAEDKKGNMWFATEHGLLKYSDKKFKLFTKQEGLSANSVQSLLADYEDNLWAGTLGSGVNLFSGETFVSYNYRNGLSTENVTAIFTEPSGRTSYIGTTDGLFIFNQSNGLFKKVTGIKEIEKANIASLSTDASGLLWIAAGNKVFVLKRQGESLLLNKQFSRIDGVPLLSPNKIIHNSEGNCLIATFGSGAFFINGKTEKSFNLQNGFPSDNILTVFEDSKSNIWFGTQDAGIIKYDGKKFSALLNISSNTDKAVWCITEDDSGNIFWGTGESGIFCYDGKTIKDYTTRDGLSADYITSLQWDKNQHCLWAGSEKGLDRIKFKASNAIDNIKTFREQDGFSASGINQNGIWIDREGLVWLGSNNGLWRFNNQFDQIKNIPPHLQLTGLRLFFQKQNWKMFSDSVSYLTGLPVNLVLPYNKNHLTFDIHALTTSDARYSFKLVGQDEDWSSAEKSNSVTYSNISPGQYTFEAKAFNGNGVQSAETISFPFIIKPPWWKTWWFYLIAALTAVTALIFFIKNRERVLRQQNVELEATVQQRTHVIEQQKQTVEKMLGEKEVLLKEIHHRVKNNLQTISSMLMLQSMELTDEEAKKAITESQSRVRSVALVHQRLYETEGLEKVELSGFTKDLTEQIQSLYESQSKNVSVSVNMPEIFVLIDKAIPLGLIINELFTNSLKYAFTETKAGQIKIDSYFIESNSSSKKVKLIYSDNGKGFNYNEISDSSPTLGVELINLLSEQIGATVSYSNTAGSEFVFIFGNNI